MTWLQWRLVGSEPRRGVKDLDRTMDPNMKWWFRQQFWQILVVIFYKWMFLMSSKNLAKEFWMRKWVRLGIHEVYGQWNCGEHINLKSISYRFSPQTFVFFSLTFNLYWDELASCDPKIQGGLKMGGGRQSGDVGSGHVTVLVWVNYSEVAQFHLWRNINMAMELRFPCLDRKQYTYRIDLTYVPITVIILIIYYITI